MSRMTAAQVIAAGDYLDPDFDPGSLTVSQLLGIFGYHNVRYPMPYTKPKLVKLFNDEIKPKTRSYKKERLKAESSMASDDGIKDGLTGEYLNPPQPLRRSSRRSSRTPTVEPEPVPEPGKRRRVSRQVSGGQAARNAEPVEAVVEESEPDEPEPPVKKTSRKKNSDDAATNSRKAPRTSNFAEDSGWEDNNMFQSGPESSSPARAAKPRSRQSVAKPASSSRRRKPSPEPLPSSSDNNNEEDEDDEQTQRPEAPAVSPVRARPPPARVSLSPARVSPPRTPAFEPVPSPQFARQSDTYGQASRTPFKAAATPAKVARSPYVAQESPAQPFLFSPPPSNSREQVRQQRTPYKKQTPSRVVQEIVPNSASEEEELSYRPEDVQELEDSDEEGDEDSVQVREVSKALGRTGSASKVVKYSPPSEPRTSAVSWLAILAAIGLALGGTYPYKQQSAAIGFCDTGSDTNDVLEGYRTYNAAVLSCQVENRTTLYPATDNVLTVGVAACPTPLETLIPVPDACTPCPADAICNGREIVCTNNLIVQPHAALSFLHFPLTSTLNISALPITFPASTRAVFEATSAVFDGLPRFGPIAFPPRCGVDPKREHRLKHMAHGLQVALKAHRAQVVCDGHSETIADADGGEARQYGKARKELYEAFRPKSGALDADQQKQFDHVFNVAVQDLEQTGALLTGLDKDGVVYMAHKTADLDFACAVRVRSREAWAEWRASVLTAAGTVLALMYARYNRAIKSAEKARAKELIPVALESLRDQEVVHYTDPVRAPDAFIPSLQLRDTLLADVHSVAQRTRIWEHVARVVEGNANVRVNEQETAAGDETRVWTWVGDGGRSAIAYEGEGGRVVA